MKTFLGFVLMFLAGYAAIELGKVMAEGPLLVEAVDREYILVITQSDKPGFEVVQAGLNKAEAEGVAVQLNEVFKRRGIPVSVRAQPQVDVGNYHPKPK